MKRTWSRLLVFVIALAPVSASAADALKNLVSSLPADTIFFLAVAEPKQLDKDFATAVKTLGLEQFLQPPFNSPTAIARTYLNLGEQFDDAGPIALILLNTSNMMELGQKGAFVISAKDPKAMLEAMGGKPGDDGIYSVALMGQPSHAAVADKRVILAENADVAKAVAGATEKLGAKFAAQDISTLDGLDVALWIDAERLMKIVKPQLDMVMAMMMMQQASTNPFAAKQAEISKKQMDMFFNGVASLSFGIGLADNGTTLRFGFRARTGSDFAKMMSNKQTSETLLRGLPADNYLLAFGSISDPAVAKETLKSYEPYFSAAESIEGIDKDQVAKLKKTLDELAPLSTGARGSVVTLPSGSDGLFAVNALIDTESSDKWMDLFGQSFDSVKKILASGGEKLGVDEEGKKVLDAITLSEAKEELPGAKTRQLTIDLSKVDDIDADEREEMQKVLGKEGVLVRFSAIDGKTVAVTFGGGAKHASGFIEKAKSKDSPLDNDPGIKRVASNLPKERSGAAYVAVDRIIEFIRTAQKTIDPDAEELPVKMPKLNAPLALVGSSANDAWRGDVYIPSELMIATKDAVMSATGMSQPAGDAAGGAPADKAAKDKQPK